MEHLTYHQFAAGIWTFTLIFATSFTSAAQEQSVIGLAEIEGRTWLITPEGKPFFAHGITHMTNRSLRTDYSAASRACKDLGFNAYGYGCPNELKSDMPYVEGRNYVPISTGNIPIKFLRRMTIKYPLKKTSWITLTWSKKEN